MHHKDPDSRALLRAYSNDGEVALSVSRIVFCAILMARYLWVAGPASGNSPAVIAQHVAGMLLGILVSIWLLARARERRLNAAALLACTVGECALCFLALRGNVLRPPLHYTGILRMPDISFTVVLVFSSALRLYWSAILTALALNAASLTLLVSADRTYNGGLITFTWNDVQMIAIEVAAAGAGALIAAWAARRTIRRVAVEAERVSRGRRYLHEVLREHHDVRTLLSSARLQLDLLRRELGDPSHTDRLAVVERAVTGIGDTLDGIKARTFGELAVSDDVAEIEPIAVVTSAVAVAQDRFPGMTIRAAITSPVPRVFLLGGERALAHAVVNVLVNACEGDGSRQATEVLVRVARRPPRSPHVLFEFVDDGPGFRPELLQTSLRGGLSTKAAGSGLGLSLVAGIVEASGGRIEIRNLPAGGACVAMSLLTGGRGAA